MKRIRIAMMVVVLSAAMLVGTAATAQPAAALDGFCGYLFSKLRALYFMVDYWGIPYGDVMYEVDGVIDAIGSSC
jgi:hypothetical protein